MNEELTPLEALEIIKENYLWLSRYAYGEQEKLDEKDNKMFDIIETALERLDKIETTTHSVLREDISNKLKALEIIKKKKVNVRFLISCKTLKEYNDVISDHLTQEEYDILKEVLL